MKKNKVTGSLLAKIVVFLLMVIFVGIGAFAGYSFLWSEAMNIYEGDFREYLQKESYQVAVTDEYFIFRWMLEEDYDLISSYCQNRNMCVRIYHEDGELLWDNYKPYYAPLTYVFYEMVECETEIIPDEKMEAPKEVLDEEPAAPENVTEVVDEAPLDEMVEAPEAVWVEEPEAPEGGIEVSDQETGASVEQIRIVVYVDSEYGYNDEYWQCYEDAKVMYERADLWPKICVSMIFLVVVCFIFLMCSAGHYNSNKEDGDMVQPGILHGIWLEVLLGIAGVAVFLLTEVVSEMIGYHIGMDYPLNAFAASVWAMLVSIIGTVVCIELAIRLKLGKILRSTLCYTILCLAGKCLKAAGRGMAAVIKGLPLLVRVIAVWSVIFFLELFGLFIFQAEAELLVIWLGEKILFLAVVCYFGLCGAKLQKAGSALAQGDINYQVDTSKMILGYKEYGNNLNSIRQGMAAAVQEQMKSEHLKTELITNVSHDLKTPLTSIINYSDLLGQAETDPDKVKEYSEVLHRQSVRLKKLLDDLLEVSKASTGNLPTDPAPCDVKVLIMQTTGEYEQRFAKKDLKLMIEEPEQDAHIMADQRHLFRIFDNLLGNIYKYAQPGSRVYLNVENEDQKVRIIFRNMSEYPLNINGEELLERFVRGDKSRHKEGSGLGLSIAMSLAQLQGGSLKIITDGDLFKAVLEFPMQ